MLNLEANADVSIRNTSDTPVTHQWHTSDTPVTDLTTEIEQTEKAACLFISLLKVLPHSLLHIHTALKHFCA